MKITIERFEGSDRFNVCIASKEGNEPFITIKGCKLMSGRKGEFISWPAWKNKNDEWKSHIYASPAFQEAVVEAVKASEPKKPAQPAKPPKDMDDDIPW